MNLTEQTVSGSNEINLQDSLNASLMKLKVTMSANTVVPDESDLLIFVDKASQESPTEEKKQYLFELKEPLRYYNSVGDELLQEFIISNNDVVMKTMVTRKIGVLTDGNSYVLDTPVTEELDAYPVTLFEGINYVYTNYENVSIELIYPKNTDENRLFSNNAMYYNHKLKNDGEFSIEDIYFKDAFTKTEDKLNLKVNNVSVDCITSNNNKFSLDIDGNLMVNSITTASQKLSLDNENICNLIYPVGSIYLSVNDIDPSSLFGGTWISWAAGRVLVGIDTTQSEFNVSEKTGGEKNHILSVSEIPSHKHDIIPNHNIYAYNYGGDAETSVPTSGDVGRSLGRYYVQTTTSLVGESKGHNNLQPYITCYMWKRVS